MLQARWPIIAASLVLIALAASGGRFLEFSSNYRVYFSSDDPRFLALDKLENTYEKSDNVLFIIDPEDRDATSEQALKAALWLTERAWQTPYSTRVDSLANFPYTTADGDDLLVRELVDPALLADPGARARIRSAALADPRIAGLLLARDGSASIVNVTVLLPGDDETAEITAVSEFSQDLAAATEQRFPGIRIRLVGKVVLNHVFAKATVQDMQTLLPVSFIIMALALGILVRGVTGVAVTGLIIVFSILAGMGLGGWVGLPLSPPTGAVPTIILTVAIADCVHILVAMQERLRDGDTKHEAIAEALRINLNPIFLSNITTALGFLTLNFSEAPPYRHLGTFVAFGVIVSCVLSVTLLPALLSLLPARATAARQRTESVIAACADFIIQRRKALLAGSAIVVLALLACIPRNQLNDVLQYFFKESAELRQDLEFLDENLAGDSVFEYSLVSSGPGGIADPAFLADVSAFAEWFRAQPDTRHVRVISDTFRQLNKSMHGDDPAAYRLPASRELASQYLFLYELSLPFGFDLNNQVDVSRSATRMVVSARTLSSQDVLALNERALAWAGANAPHIKEVVGTGSTIVFSHIGQRNIRSMLFGTGLALLVISLLLVVALRSTRIGLVSLVPNFIPALMGFGVWGLLVGEVDLALSGVVAITLGIVVDDSVHFLSKYLRARREYGCAPAEAVRYSVTTVGRALFITSTVLVAGFLVLTLSQFLPTAKLGFLSSAIIVFALAADFLLLPPLLMLIDRHETRTT